MTQEERADFLIKIFLKENKEVGKIDIPKSFEEKKMLLRGLMNIRMPKNLDENILKVQDEYLREETKRKGITDIDDLKPLENNIYLWQGDITTLKCDAIVNAANSKLLGCFYPCHNCIDNAIHTYAGVELRQCCNEIMEKQGYDEPTGTAKITPAFNLPSRYVLHTVGPIIYGDLTEKDCDNLASCYKSCLELAEKNGLNSVAFCCISTGEFRFPNEKAGEIAVHTVKKFLKDKNSKMKVIFNVFKEKDYEIYNKLLGKN